MFLNRCKTVLDDSMVCMYSLLPCAILKTSDKAQKNTHEYSRKRLQKEVRTVSEEKKHFPDEEAHLEMIEEVLEDELQKVDDVLSHAEAEYQNAALERKENYYDMDTRERLAVDKAMHSMDANIAALDRQKKHIERLKSSPFFARIDFAEGGELPAVPWYLGRYSLDRNQQMLILDWRAPLASMFYDYDVGPAGYDAPDGRFEGALTLKRQFRIADGRLYYVIDSSETISDSILQEELSRTSDERMKTIIATIQKEQNVVIRNEKAGTMIIQGAAGSGKTSISLHRIAFLLYRFRGKIKANDVLVLSPSKVFSDFISGVIPELGEEPVRETDFYEIAMDLLDNIIDFEDPEDPLDITDQRKLERACFRSSGAFLKLLKDYAEVLPDRILKDRDFVYDGTVLENSWIREQFLFYKTDPVLERLPVIAEEMAEELLIRRGRHRIAPEKGALLNWLRSQMNFRTPAAVYRDFFRCIGQERLLLISKSYLEWADVFPFLFLYHHYHGLPRDRRVKHLVVDEMQDYTPTQYAVLELLYPCSKTILGDFYQRVDPTLSAGLPELLEVFPGADLIRLNKSYRSTHEIMSFAKRFCKDAVSELVERHGETPELLQFSSEEEEFSNVLSRIEAFKKSTRTSLGIILSSQKAADAFYEKLKRVEPGVNCLNRTSAKFRPGVTVTSVRMSKGLEFDEVLIPGVTEALYGNEKGRMLLYVACTRAMHKLTLTSTEELPL